MLVGTMLVGRLGVREYSRAGYGAPVFYSDLRGQTGEHGFPRMPTGITIVLLLQKSPRISGNPLEFTGEASALWGPPRPPTSPIIMHIIIIIIIIIINNIIIIIIIIIMCFLYYHHYHYYHYYGLF